MRSKPLFAEMLRVAVLVAFLWPRGGAQIIEKEPHKTIMCPRAGNKIRSQKVDGDDPVRKFTEISGLVLSPTQLNPSTGNPIMYVVNDGHERNKKQALGRVGVYDSGTGDRLATLKITSGNRDMVSHDWEAMTIGACSRTDANTCIYIADIGDNVARNTLGRRSGRNADNPYRILKIREPNLSDLTRALSANHNSNTFTVELLDSLEFDYSHTDSPKPYADSEAIFFDHVGWGGSIGDIYLVTKWNQADARLTRLYKMSVFAWYAQGIYSPRPVGAFTKDHHLRQGTWTGADSTADGTVIALSDHFKTYLFLRCPGASMVEALMSNSCYQFDHPSPGQVETSALSVDGKKHLEIPEGNLPAIGWTELVYSNNAGTMASLFGGVAATNQVCPDMEWVVQETKPGERETVCQTQDGLVKSSLWCHANPNEVPLVVIQPEEVVDMQPTEPSEAGTQDKPTEDIEPLQSEDDPTQSEDDPAGLLSKLNFNHRTLRGAR